MNLPKPKNSMINSRHTIDPNSINRPIQPKIKYFCKKIHISKLPDSLNIINLKTTPKTKNKTNQSLTNRTSSYSLSQSSTNQNTKANYNYQKINSQASLNKNLNNCKITKLNNYPLSTLILNYYKNSDDEFLKSNPIINSLEHITIDQPNKCCKETIHFHSDHNKLIVCENCHKKIKIYDNFDIYKNFLVFCNSRNRQVLSSKVGDYLIAICNCYK